MGSEESVVVTAAVNVHGWKRAVELECSFVVSALVDLVARQGRCPLHWRREVEAAPGGGARWGHEG